MITCFGKTATSQAFTSTFASRIISCIWTVKLLSILAWLTLCGNISKKMRKTFLNLRKSSLKTRKYFSLSIPVPTWDLWLCQETRHQAQEQLPLEVQELKGQKEVFAEYQSKAISPRVKAHFNHPQVRSKRNSWLTTILKMKKNWLRKKNKRKWKRKNKKVTAKARNCRGK